MKKWVLELWEYRELLIALIAREIKIRYKQTLLGALWAIMQPAALTIIFTIVFSVFLKVNSGDVPYPIFAYSALLPWTFFATAVSFGALSVVNNGGLVTKVYFPREILPLASIGAAFFDFLNAGLVFLVMFIVYGLTFNAQMLFVFLIIPPIFLLTVGISLILATLNVLYRDIRFVVPLLLQVWLYLTPVIYSVSQVPEKYKFVFFLNPLAFLVEFFRDVTVYRKQPNWEFFALSVFFSFSIFLLGYWFFKSKEKIFADVI